MWPNKYEWWAEITLSGNLFRYWQYDNRAKRIECKQKQRIILIKLDCSTENNRIKKAPVSFYILLDFSIKTDNI